MGGLVYYAQGLCLIGRAVVIWAEPDTKIEADCVALLWLGELVVGMVLNACSSHRCRNSMAVGPRGRNIMVVFALIGGYYCSWIMRRPLNMFPYRTPVKCAFVVTPVVQKRDKIVRSFHIFPIAVKELDHKQQDRPETEED